MCNSSSGSSLLVSLGIRHIDGTQTYRQAKHWQNKIQKFKSHLEHPPKEWASGFYPPFFNSGPDYQAEREGAREMMDGSSGLSCYSIYIYSFKIAHSFRSSIKETQNNSIISLNISHRKQRQRPYCCIIKESLANNFQNNKKWFTLQEADRLKLTMAYEQSPHPLQQQLLGFEI